MRSSEWDEEEFALGTTTKQGMPLLFIGAAYD